MHSTFFFYIMRRKNGKEREKENLFSRAGRFDDLFLEYCTISEKRKEKALRLTCSFPFDIF